MNTPIPHPQATTTGTSAKPASHITDIDRLRAKELAHLFGGNGLSMNQSCELVAAKLAEHRLDPLGLTTPLHQPITRPSWL